MRILVPLLCSSLMIGTISKGMNPFDSNKVCLNFSAGAAIPLNNFRMKGPSSPFDSILKGNAETGFHFNLSADWYIFHHIGITGIYGLCINPFDTKAYNEGLDFSVPTTTSAGNFYLQELMLGLCSRFRINPKITLHVKVMCGDLETNYPNVTILVPATSLQAAGTDKLVVNSPSSFIWSCNAGINYAYKNHLSFLVDISYSAAKIGYTYGTTLSQTLQGSQTLTSTSIGSPMSMSLGLIKPTIGISYSF